MKHMIKIEINRSVEYRVYVEEDIWPDLVSFTGERYDSDTAVVVIDGNVDQYHGDQIRKKLGERFENLHFYIVEPGETSKSVSEWNKLIDFLLDKKVRRNTPVLVFGGGVTGDLAGFASASALRGVPLIHIPTTLLAMVDSSIGGKTGINHASGKNLVGAFYQPDAVFAGLSFLTTLPEREWICGLAEVIKYGAIARPGLIDETYALLEEKVFRPDERWKRIIERSAAIKADIVCRDEMENGIRSWLNFGHTFAHAIETYQQYEGWTHGEAVYAGMIAAAFASNGRGAKLEINRLLQFEKFFRLNADGLGNKIEDLLRLMYSDKKIISGNIRLVLLESWGRPLVAEIEEIDTVREAWKYLFSELTDPRHLEWNN